MINLVINVEFYKCPESLLCLWPSKVEKFLVVAFNQQEARHIFTELCDAVKYLKGTKILPGSKYIECPAGNVKIITWDDIPDKLKGLHGIGVLVTDLAYEHLNMKELMSLHYVAASFFDAIDAAPRQVHIVKQG